ncbi:uncharacterized protein LOC142814608 isoform X2 [Rhipicephalus microplus]|uniref:uncharacterized protein LOC142814608 isoform X2 n=1 Tax=Rhipicephalus microplus TaxID=6941 RepID=UPI003F6A98BD
MSCLARAADAGSVTDSTPPASLPVQPGAVQLLFPPTVVTFAFAAAAGLVRRERSPSGYSHQKARIYCLRVR